MRRNFPRAPRGATVRREMCAAAPPDTRDTAGFRRARSRRSKPHGAGTAAATNVINCRAERTDIRHKNLKIQSFAVWVLHKYLKHNSNLMARAGSVESKKMWNVGLQVNVQLLVGGDMSGHVFQIRCFYYHRRHDAWFPVLHRWRRCWMLQGGPALIDCMQMYCSTAALCSRYESPVHCSSPHNQTLMPLKRPVIRILLGLKPNRRT